MRIWILMRTADDAPVDGVYTSYESAMMAWGGEAAEAERDGATVTDDATIGLYEASLGDERIIVQEWEL